MKQTGTLLALIVLSVFPVMALAASPAKQEFDSALRSRPDTDHGRDIYATCAACHGSTGAGVKDGSVPAIGGQHFKALVRQLVDYRHDKRWDPRMTQFSAKFHLANAQAIADVAAYIESLGSHWESGQASEYSAQGAELYSRLCSGCHGDEAEGNRQQGIPRLRGQHFEYLVRQMHDMLEERRSNRSRDHVRPLEPFGSAVRVEIAGHLAGLSP